MSKINILHIMNNFEDASISRIVLGLIKHLGHEEYRWHVGAVGVSGDMRAEFNRLGVAVVNFSIKTHQKSSKDERIKDYVLKHGIEIIHTHTPRTILSVVLSRISNVTHISTKHLLFSPDDRRWGHIHTLWDRLSLYVPDQVVAVSETMYRQILSQPALKKSRIAVIRNAIPVENFYVPDQRIPYRCMLDLPADSLVIGYSGRIQKVKRIDLLLLAFSDVLSHFPKARLVLAGEGDLKSQLQSYADKLGIGDAVTWLGFCREIPRLLAAIDVYVQPSSNEGLSLSILEAMAAGKPVIATKVGGATEVLKHMETGFIIPPKSSLAISSAIVNLLNHTEERLRLGEAARKRVLQEFNVQPMAESYGSLYKMFTRN